MTNYNLSALETELAEQGWTIESNDFVVPQDVPGQVFQGGYQITLVSPSGDAFGGEAATRADALRAAAGRAGVLPDNGVTLI